MYTFLSSKVQKVIMVNKDFFMPNISPKDNFKVFLFNLQKTKK